jgi:hypothetical protein
MHAQISKLGTKKGRDDWGTQLGATSVNAFYNVKPISPW